VRYFLKTVVGLGLLVASIVAISYAVFQLLQIGTCASGGPYVSARECPSGIERVGLAIPVAAFVMLIGAALYATRGAPPGSSRKGKAGYALALIWAGLFLGIAFACFWGVWGPDVNPGPGGETGGLIVGFLFVPLGLLGVVPILAAAKAARAAGEASGIGMGDAVELARGARKVDFGDLVQQIQERAPASPAPASAGDGSLNPVAAIAHVLAIAVGLWGGFWIMGRVTPDLPDPVPDPGLAQDE
jgi:hypothetical protein